jgi:hypothetical protein
LVRFSQPSEQTYNSSSTSEFAKMRRIVGLVVFGGCDLETGLIVALAFEKGFSKAQNICAWEQVGVVPLSRKCLQSLFSTNGKKKHSAK